MYGVLETFHGIISRKSNLQGDIAHGGYSGTVRVHERFLFPLPKEILLEEIAPMLCADLTVYFPLVRNGAGQVISPRLVVYKCLTFPQTRKASWHRWHHWNGVCQSV